MTNSELAAEVYTFDIQKWMRLSMNALAIYEYATTCDQEVMSIWKRKGSGASLLLFAVRYVMLFAALPGVVSLGKANRKECMGITIVGYILILLSNALTAAFSALRVYALCGGSVRLSVPIFLLQLSPVVVNMYDFIETEIDVDPLSKCIREIKWGFKTEQAFIYGSRIPLTVGDLLVLIITWTKSFYQLRIQRSLGVHYSLSTLMFRDGTVYFLLLLALNVLEMSPLTATEGGYVVSVLSSTLPLILVNRFILNLRQLNDSEAHSVNHIRTISTPMFRLSVDIAGNMGESLEHGWEAGDGDEIGIEVLLNGGEATHEGGLEIEEVPRNAGEADFPEHQLT